MTRHLLGSLSLASMLVKHHSDAHNELMELASSKGLSLPEHLAQAQKIPLPAASTGAASNSSKP